MAWQRETAWRRFDERGEERSVFICDAGTCVVEGIGAVAINGSGLIFEYRIEHDVGWSPVRATIVSRLGPDEFRLALEHRADGTWTVDGLHVAEYDGCTDIDLAFSPSTNVTTIRRLALEPGKQGRSTAVYVTEPELTLQRIEQTYRRLDQTTYEYRSGEFTARLEVDQDGIVTSYPGHFEVAISPVAG